MIRRFGAALLLASLAACIVAPHTSQKFPAIRGHIVDATTQKPLGGAEVRVQDHPNATATTGADGVFRLKSRRNYHLGYTLGMCPSDWPDGDWWPVVLEVTCAGYAPLEVQPFADLFAESDGDRELEAPAIALVPSGK